VTGLNWTRGAGRPRAARPDRVDVIITVYGAPDDLRQCLTSVAEQTDLSRHRVRLVIDGPQDESVEAVLAAHSFDLLRNDRRLGFAAGVNRGMSASNSDVVLLNSDTVVTAHWLEKLIDAAYSSGDAGTVTPLSNNATLCSVPRSFDENAIPAGFDLASFAAHVERVSARSYPRLPTGVGFCFYIRRALIDDIGLFDDRRFAAGYGEENDFCLRALDRGWLHLADDATFVQHAGHRSFGASHASRLRRAQRRLPRRYMAMIAEFMKRDPLAEVRARIVAGRVVHLVHGWPPFQHGGTELYAQWLVHRQRASRHVAVYARGEDPSRVDGEAVELRDGEVRVRVVTNHFTSRNPLRRNAIRSRAVDRDFDRFLREESPELLHVHHLAGHAFSLMRVARRLGIPIVLQIQDWWFLCARVNQLHRDGSRCSGPAPAKCASCVTLTNVPLANRLLHALRRAEARRAIRAASAYVAGSNAIRDDYAALVDPETPFHVIPYGVPIAGTRVPRTPARKPLRFGYVGSDAPHKGLSVAIEAMRGIDPADATLQIWGSASGQQFDEADKPRIYASMDVLLMPSIGLESFGLVAREAMARGVPVIASSGGALSEMFEPGVCGDFFTPGDAAALVAIIRRVVDDPGIVDRWSAKLPGTKSADVHAEEIELVYQSVLAAR
jgi:GT2 family glycosyltransferase/glycosyltransferase involved in cell wall biosynthesis